VGFRDDVASEEDDDTDVGVIAPGSEDERVETVIENGDAGGGGTRIVGGRNDGAPAFAVCLVWDCAYNSVRVWDCAYNSVRV
jgi:hypothetical protein